MKLAFRFYYRDLDEALNRYIRINDIMDSWIESNEGYEYEIKIEVGEGEYLIHAESYRRDNREGSTET